LITTADERTWPKEQPVVFLGEWCRLHNRKTAWESLDAEVVPYHWDHRKKLNRDYHYLQGLYEELLQELAERLNDIHGVEYSLRYWRILVGPWLGYFVQMLFDRWTMIEQAVRDKSIIGVRVLETPPERMVPNDMRHFWRLFVGDLWNETIYGQLLQGWTAVPIEKIQPSEAEGSARSRDPVPLGSRWLKRKLEAATWIISQVLTRETDVFFIATYLPIQQDFRLQWSLGQLPKRWRSLAAPEADVVWAKRRWQMTEPTGEGFPSIVRRMIPRHIPTLYLEGYGALQACCNVLPWPKKPRLIFTSNAYGSDDVFKAWAAAKVEAGAPLVGGQHGGSYGVARWNFNEDHECAISDAWLSWGWKDEGNPKVKPVGYLKLSRRRLGWDPNGYALMVGMTMPRTSHFMLSVPVAGQWLSYFEDQCGFVTALPESLRGRLLVRLFSKDYGWCQEQRWLERFPQIQLDEGLVPIRSLIEKSRLYISTYNATTFLDSMTMDIPTVMFWNPKHWELRYSAIPYFEDLKRVGLFHETPRSAARHVAAIWDDVEVWWNSPMVRDALVRFKNRFCHSPNDLLKNVERTLREALVDTHP